MMHIDRLPVIIGSGLSGCLISLSLSEENIPHIMIGDMPNNKPRPGESLNALSTLGLHPYTEALQDTAFTKADVVLYRDGHRYTCQVNMRRKWTGRFWLRLIGHGDAPAGFYHIDRIRFDQKLFDMAVRNPCCHFIQDRVASLDYDAPGDTITAIHLAQGETIIPEVVFDATNHFGVVPKAAGVTRISLSTPQRLIFAHFCSDVPPAEDALERPNWQYQTHVIRLTEADHNINGQMWLMSMGNYLSVGASFDADYVAQKSDDELWDCVGEAAAAWGLDYRVPFPQKVNGFAGQMQHYMYERGYGANWLLSGPTHASFYWTISAGVATAVETARAAPRFLENRQKTGEQVTYSIQQLLNTHQIHDRIFYNFQEAMTPWELLGIGDQLIVSNIRQMNRGTQLRRERRYRVVGSLLGRIFPNKFVQIRNYCYLDDGIRQADLPSPVEPADRVQPV